MDYKNRYSTINNLIKRFFHKGTTSPAITSSPVLDKLGCYLWRKDVSEELSARIEAICKETKNNEESSATTTGCGSPLTLTLVSDYSPSSTYTN